MLETLAGFLANLKGPSPVVWLGVALASALILFLPFFVSDPLGLDAFRAAYKPFLGSALVLAGAFLLAELLARAVARGKALLGRRRARLREAKGMVTLYPRLHELTPDEKAYLRVYVLEDENTQKFFLDDGVAGGLLAKKISYRSATQVSVYGAAYNLEAWARRYLKERPELLQWANPKLPIRKADYDF